jgi:HSP20 family protein
LFLPIEKEECIMTTVMRMNPWAGFGPVDSEFDSLVRRALGPSSSWVPAADVTREGSDAIITLEVPGVKPSEVTVEVKDRHLVITGARDERTYDEDADAGVIRREIRTGEFTRSFRLPAHVTADAVSAHYEDGLLHVRVSGVRKPEPEPTRIPITTTVNHSA